MRNPIVEQVLGTTLNLDWEYTVGIPIDKIDMKQSKLLQVRVDSHILKEKVREYAESMERGDQFPAPVLFLDGDRYVISDGMQRIQAKIRIGQKITDAYVVVCDDPVVRAQLSFEWNTLNGEPGPESDRDYHAVALASHGMNAKGIAQSLHIPVRRVEEVLADDKGHRRARDLGVKSPWSKIPSRPARVRLHRNLLLDQPFAAAVKLAGTYTMNNEQVRDFVNEILEFRTEYEQVNFIATRTKETARRAAQLAKEKAGRRRGSNPNGASPFALYKGHLQYLINNSTQAKGQEITRQNLDNFLGQLLRQEKGELLDLIRETMNGLQEASSKIIASEKVAKVG